MSTTLTERYIAATVKTLPESTQADVRAELSASIDDAVEARIDQGEDAAAAERAVLTDLGDPDILAAGYADRPLQLIGPKYFLTWWRLLKLLWIIVPICTLGGVALAQFLAGAGIGEVIGASIGATVSAIVHVGFWTTLVFVILERTGTGTDTGVAWSVDQLPEPTTSGVGRVDLIASLVMAGIAVAALLWDRFIGFVWVDGSPVPILNPDLWPWSLAAIFVLIGAEAGIAVAVFSRRRWTTPIAIANTVVAGLFMSLTLTLFGRDELVNPAIVELVFAANGVDADIVRILGVLLAFGLVAIPSWDIADGWFKTAKAARLVS